MLDRDRYYAIVYGDPVAKFYQDKTFYRGNGTPVNSDGVIAKEPEDAPVVVELPEKKADPNVAKLESLHISKLKKIATKLAETLGQDAPELKGKGLKKRLIAYIVENTE